jgi:hypothetical protein
VERQAFRVGLDAFLLALESFLPESDPFRVALQSFLPERHCFRVERQSFLPEPHSFGVERESFLPERHAFLVDDPRPRWIAAPGSTERDDARSAWQGSLAISLLERPAHSSRGEGRAIGRSRGMGAL